MEATIFGLSAYLGLLFLTGSLVLGAMTAAFVMQAIFGLGRGKFWDKLARQLAAMGVKGLLGFLLLLAPAVVWLSGLVEIPDGLALGPKGRLLRDALLPLLSGWLGLIIYSGSWIQLRHNRPLHRVLGGVSLVAVLAGTYCTMNVLALWASWAEPAAGGPAWEKMWLPAHWTIWPAFAAIVGNGIGAAGALGMGYLVLRRNRDDFGRDYYRFALPQAARWGLVLLLPVAITAGWLAWRGVTWTPFSAAHLGGVGVAALVGVWLNVRVIRSRHPLRLKGSVFAACLLAWILDAALVLFFLRQSGGI